MARVFPLLSTIALWLLLWAPAVSADEAAPGATFDQPPVLLPGGLPPASYLAEGSLERAIELFKLREHVRARAELEAYLAPKRPHDAEWLRACYLYGYLCLLDEDWQLASLHFYRVRSSEHPLAVHALFNEAYVDYRRGKYRASIPECEQYVERFPNGPHVDRCELLIADSHREAGHAASAIKLYKEYMEAREDENLDEQMHLSMARAYEVAGNHSAATRMYTNLLINHQFATNGEAAEAGLQRLRDAGVEVPELTDQELWLRANALKNSYRWQEGYAVFKELYERYQEQPDSEFYKKLEANEYAFRWQTRQYSAIALESARKYDAAPGAAGASEHLYRAIKGFNKGGDFTNAAKYADIARSKYGSSGRFAGIDQDLAWYFTNGADYEGALGAWKRCYERRKKGLYRWMVAYTTYRAGHYEEAIDALSPLVDSGGSYAQAARFYRAKCNISLNRLGSARADFDAILKEEPLGWYAQVIESRRRRARRDEMPVGQARVGAWPEGAQPIDVAVPAAPEDRDIPAILATLNSGPFPSGPPSYPRASTANVGPDGGPLPAPIPEQDAPSAAGPRPSEANWASLVWPYPEGEAAAPVPAVPPASPHVRYPDATAGVDYDRDKAMRTFAKFAETYEAVWPELGPAYELAVLGFEQEAALLVAGIYEEILEVQRSRRIARAVESYEKEKADAEQQADAALAEAIEEDPDAGPSAMKTEEVQRPAMLPALRDEERWRRMRDIRTSGLAWRDLFILVGDPYHMLTFSDRAYRPRAFTRDDPDVQAALRQGYPLAFGQKVWGLCREQNLDPMLIFALMRQESTYHPTIVSPAGAVGMMQIMPGTGAKVAALSGMGSYSNDRLREPDVNIALGIWYLGRLMDRFDGQYPMAVGSYNGGPHNIGRWLRSKHGIGMEEFVDEIPFNETRDYVKKVVRNYASYLAIYGEDAYVQVPRTTKPDNPKVINF